MQVEQYHFTEIETMNPGFTVDPDVILVFGNRLMLEDDTITKKLKQLYPKAVLAGCSSAGHILDGDVSDHTVNLTAIRFFYSRATSHSVRLTEKHSDPYAAGRHLASKFDKQGLRHVLVLSDGLHVNGSDLIDGIVGSLDKSISISGGLAGDSDQFKRTLVLDESGSFRSATISAVGFYGDRLSIQTGAYGGWEPFGMPRTVTASEGNILFEIDNQPALDVYKQFLGPKAEGLPASGLLIPLSFEINGEAIIRTILGVNEDSKTMRFAGDIPEGVSIRFMKAGADELIDGAERAAELASKDNHVRPDLVLMISCVGRKLVLQQMVEEEVEAVRDTMRSPHGAGFYSYGELGPLPQSGGCRLLNQTMTLTTFKEL